MMSQATYFHSITCCVALFSILFIVEQNDDLINLSLAQYRKFTDVMLLNRTAKIMITRLITQFVFHHGRMFKEFGKTGGKTDRFFVIRYPRIGAFIIFYG